MKADPRKAREKAHFDRNPEAYARAFYEGIWRAYRRLMARLLRARKPRFEAVLDVGCGPLPSLPHLLPHCERYVAVDLSPRSLEHLSRHYPEVETLEGDAEALPLNDGEFDLVLSHGVLHHLPDPARAVAQFSRVLQPGGRLLVFEPAPTLDGYLETADERGLSAAELARLLGAFRVEHLEGLLHSRFMAAVCRAAAHRLAPRQVAFSRPFWRGVVHLERQWARACSATGHFTLVIARKPGPLVEANPERVAEAPAYLSEELGADRARYSAAGKEVSPGASRPPPGRPGRPLRSPGLPPALPGRSSR